MTFLFSRGYFAARFSLVGRIANPSYGSSQAAERRLQSRTRLPRLLKRIQLM
jgi:hypothetical protein